MPRNLADIVFCDLRVYWLCPFSCETKNGATLAIFSFINFNKWLFSMVCPMKEAGLNKSLKSFSSLLSYFFFKSDFHEI